MKNEEKRTPKLRVINGVTPESVTFQYGPNHKVLDVVYAFADKQGISQVRTEPFSQVIQGLSKQERETLDAFLHWLDVQFDCFVPEQGA